MPVELKESVEVDLADDRACDFCGCPAVTVYPSKPLSVSQTVTHVDGNPVALVTENQGDWLACAPCERLVEQERYDRLADRAARRADRLARVEVALAGVPRKVGRRFRSEAGQSVRQMVDAFAAARHERGGRQWLTS
jgi:hypothetical protein